MKLGPEALRGALMFDWAASRGGSSHQSGAMKNASRCGMLYIALYCTVLYSIYESGLCANAARRAACHLGREGSGLIPAQVQEDALNLLNQCR